MSSMPAADMAKEVGSPIPICTSPSRQRWAKWWWVSAT